MVTDELRMSRGRLYVLIDGFEQDMREVIENELLSNQSVQQILTPKEYELVVMRQKLDESGEEVTAIHYLDLQTCFEVMMRSKAALPHALVEDIVSNAGSISQLVPIRHRVMHGRPLNAEDTGKASMLLASFNSGYWARTRQTIGRLKADSTWEPYFEKLPVPFEKTLHNLPEVDYDETSFIGRKQESERLLTELKKRRHSVITVTGEGGIGKTAIALDVAYRLLDSVDNPYEAILWVSLKTEKLTAYGVIELRNAIRGIVETITEIGRGISADFVGSLDDLADALEGIQALIVVDNLESAQGEEIVKMYDVLPTSANYLFTSRIGIGQLERRFPLPPLDASEAILLMRKFAAARGQKKLSSMSIKSISKVVEQLRFSPLAIRWYVLSSEAGKVPLDTLRDQRALLDFCVKNVYDGLRENSRAVLAILRALDRSIGFDEFAILTDFTIDDLRIATQELTQGSLVAVEAESAGAIAGKLALTPTARTFISRPDHTGAFIAEVLQRERKYKASLEEKEGRRASYYDAERVVSQDDSDRPAVFLLTTAMRHARAGQYEKAHAEIDRARSFMPELSEIYRVSGLVTSREGHYEAAVSQFQTALYYANDDLAIGGASFQLADVLARRLHDSTLAVPHARRAYEHLPNNTTQFLLGKVLVWAGEYSEGQVCVENSLESATGRHRLIVSTVLIDSWSRWASLEYSAVNLGEALAKASAGFYRGSKIMQHSGKDDRLLAAISECAIWVFRSIARMGASGGRTHDVILQVSADFIDQNVLAIDSRKKRPLADAIDAVVSNIGVTHRMAGKLTQTCVRLKES